MPDNMRLKNKIKKLDEKISKKFEEESVRE